MFRQNSEGEGQDQEVGCGPKYFQDQTRTFLPGVSPVPMRRRLGRPKGKQHRVNARHQFLMLPLTATSAPWE